MRNSVNCAFGISLSLLALFLTPSVLPARCDEPTQSAIGNSKSAIDSPGLAARDDGTVLLRGKPFRGIGANYFSLFTRLLKNTNDTSSLSNLSSLASAKIPFVRFAACGYWPAEQQLYLNDREEFLRRFDRVVRKAEDAGVGLIPSLFWHLPTVSDLAHESMQQLGNPSSKSIALIRRYTKDLVGRYGKSPAIWAWEFGNESALSIDLPNAAQNRPPVVPELGTASRRTDADDLTFSQLRVAYVAFAESVRSRDRSRLIFSGNAFPRDSAWHNSQEKSWKADSAVQFREILLRDNPDPMDAISVHLYASRGTRYPAGAKTIEEIIALAVETARAAHKPLFIGEFGAERQLGSITEQRAVFNEMLAAIEKHKVPLSAFWVFDFPNQDKNWNVTFENDRSSFIDLVAEANVRLNRRE